jgi:hypothetical protein
MNPPDSTPHPRGVVVAGDVTMDWNLAGNHDECGASFESR